eukprot:TRINITY_DN6631_c0_g2_i1.p2 TRINITY_DN6631_c0_g2~~TRINITY_DN6631_c0_g2_i1.p2  ORF type:complete len:247 (+),score=8.07 TRINITY_DN6631_c0_g2_i1:355-1095(+)
MAAVAGHVVVAHNRAPIPLLATLHMAAAHARITMELRHLAAVTHNLVRLTALVDGAAMAAAAGPVVVVRNRAPIPLLATLHMAADRARITMERHRHAAATHTLVRWTASVDGATMVAAAGPVVVVHRHVHTPLLATRRMAVIDVRRPMAKRRVEAATHMLVRWTVLEVGVAMAAAASPVAVVHRHAPSPLLATLRMVVSSAQPPMGRGRAKAVTRSAVGSTVLAITTRGVRVPSHAVAGHKPGLIE